MGNLIDMTGQRCGRLTVIERAGSNIHKKATWRCHCDCGKEVVVSGNHLRSGMIKSCGCLHKEFVGKVNDLSGQYFGSLVVLKRVGSTKQGNATWLCRCTCGNEIIAVGSKLCLGRTTGCGCRRGEKEQSQVPKGIYHVNNRDQHKRLIKAWENMISRCYYTGNVRYERYGGRGITVCAEWRDNYEAFRDWALANGYDENAPRGQCTLDRIDNDGPYSPENCRWVDMKTQANNKSTNRKKEETA